MVKSIIFDMDGVIVDSEPIYARFLPEFLRKLGISDAETIRDYKGTSSRVTWTRLVEEHNLKHDVEKLIADARQGYFDYLTAMPELPAIPGAVELIEHLDDAGHSLALASSASARRIDLFLNKLGLHKHFSALVCGDDVPRSKPEPDIFLHAAKLLGTPPADCIVIEDAEKGVRAAKAAGMHCVAYGGSAHNVDDLSAADHIVTELRDLKQYFRSAALKI